MMGKVTPDVGLSVIVVISTVIMLILCIIEADVVGTFVYLLEVVASAIGFVLHSRYCGGWDVSCCSCRLLGLGLYTSDLLQTLHLSNGAWYVRDSGSSPTYCLILKYLMVIKSSCFLFLAIL